MANTHSAATIDIKISAPYGGFDGRPCIHIKGRDVTVVCVDGKEYRRRFRNKEEAEDARKLIAIVPAWGWKEAQ